MTKSTVIDEAGVEMTGPEEPGLQRAEVEEGKAVFANTVSASRVLEGVEDQPGKMVRGSAVPLGSVGRVSPDQAGGGILSGRIRVSDDMVARARAVSPAPLDAATVRAMLEAAFTA